MLFKYFLIFLVFPYVIFLNIDYKNNIITINKIKKIDLNNFDTKKKKRKKESIINKKNLFMSSLTSYSYISKIHFKPLLWIKCTLDYGTGEACSTGLLYGVISVLLYSLKSSVLNNLFFNRFSFNLFPCWNRKILKSKTKIIIITIPLLLFFYISVIVISYIKIMKLQRRKRNE